MYKIRGQLGSEQEKLAFDKGVAIVDGQGPFDDEQYITTNEEVARRVAKWHELSGGNERHFSATMLGIYAHVCSIRQPNLSQEPLESPSVEADL